MRVYMDAVLDDDRDRVGVRARSGEGDHVLLAKPNKTAGRIVLGPRRLGHDYVRIVARPDGSGRVEIYDRSSGAWGDALERCSFSDVWRAPAVDDAMTLASLLEAR